MMKKLMLFAATLLSAVQLLACWQSNGKFYPFGNNMGIELLDKAITKAEEYNNAFLSDSVGRSKVYVFINEYLQNAEVSVQNSFKPTAFDEKLYQADIWDNLYVYEVESVTGNTVTIKTNPDGEPIVLEEIENVEEFNSTLETQIKEKMTGKEKLLISLEKIEGNTVKLVTKGIMKTISDKYSGIVFTESPNACLQLLIEKDSNSENQKAVVKEYDFKDCTLSKLDTQLPLTPRAKISQVTVKSTTYEQTVRKYHLRTAKQNQILEIVEGELSTTISNNATTETKNVTSAQLVVTDESFSVDKYNAPYVSVSKNDLPIFGRYAVNPEGIQPNEKLKCQLVLIVDGIKSSIADDKLIKITNAPAVQEIQITKVNRPMR